MHTQYHLYTVGVEKNKPVILVSYCYFLLNLVIFNIKTKCKDVIYCYIR
jgi:hypothetical protein